MKLATLRDSSRDGQLVVVSKDGTRAHLASAIATRLGQVLDDWGFLSPQLEDLSTALSLGKARHAFPFDPARCAAVLPRPAGLTRWHDGTPLAGHPGAERLIGGRERHPEDAAAARAGWAVITGDIRAGTPPNAALEGIRLVTLALDWHRGAPASGALLGAEPLATVLGPLAVTPDELGADGTAWLARPPRLAGIAYDDPVEPRPMNVDVGAALARCAAVRPLPAGHVLILLADGPPRNADPARTRVDWVAEDGSTPFGAIATPSPQPDRPPTVAGQAAGLPGA